MDIQEKIDSYIKNRLEQYRGWYDRKAVKMKKYYLRSRVSSAIIAVLVPVISNLNFPQFPEIDVSKISVTILSTTVAILIALESVLNFRKQWKNYRTTEQYLMAQKQLFLNRSGDYYKFSEEEAFQMLVNRVETAITEENAVTLNVLTKIDNNSNNKYF